MSTEIINPNNEQHWLECRTKDITSTEIAALFGFSPYITEFEVWHRKKSGDVVKLEENERMEWGTALQDAIAAKVAQKNNWTIRRMDEYMRDTELRAGASFDFQAIKDEDVGKEAPLDFLLEIKNVDGLQFKNGWKEDEEGNIEAPLHIEIQVQHQLMVSGRTLAYIGALVGGNRLVLLKRTRHEAVILQIMKKIVAFWASVEENRPPQPNFQQDAEFIKNLYGFAEPGTLIDMTGNLKFQELAREHKRLGDIEKEAKAKRDAIKAEMLTMIGSAEKVEGGEFSISCGIISVGPVSYVRESYRNFKLSWRKVK